MNRELRNSLSNFELLQDDKQIKKISDSIIANYEKEAVERIVDLFRKEIKKSSNQKILYLLKIIEKYPDKTYLKVLTEAFENENCKPIKEDVCNVIGKIDDYQAREFLQKNLSDKEAGYRCAISLSNYKDKSGIPVLLKTLKNSIKTKNLYSEALKALIKLNNEDFKNDLIEYLTDEETDEQEKFKIYRIFLTSNNSLSIPYLIRFYEYYQNRRELTFKDVKPISLNFDGLIVNKSFRRQKNLFTAIEEEISEFMHNFSFVDSAKNFLEKIK